jgi:hypothetical protein
VAWKVAKTQLERGEDSSWATWQESQKHMLSPVVATQAMSAAERVRLRDQLATCIEVQGMHRCG